MYEQVKEDVINKIWDIAKISPEHGNALMDILGVDLYNQIASLTTSK